MEEHLRAGNLPEALAAAIAAVRAAPADAAARLLLCQLLTVMGQWDRSITQWKVLSDLDPNSVLLARTCTVLAGLEKERDAVFAGERLPVVFGEPEPWAAGLLQAVRLAAQGRFEEAQRLRDDALEQVPAVAGTFNGKSFEWIADADSRIGPMLEAVIEGRYFWIPFNRIASIVAGPPGNLRDLVWATATFTWSNGGTAAGYVPARYPGAWAGWPNAALLGRLTSWNEPAPGWFQGVGQRTFSTEGDDHALLDMRLIEFTRTSAETVANG